MYGALPFLPTTKSVLQFKSFTRSHTLIQTAPPHTALLLSQTIQTLWPKDTLACVLEEPWSDPLPLWPAPLPDPQSVLYLTLTVICGLRFFYIFLCRSSIHSPTWGYLTGITFLLPSEWSTYVCCCLSFSRAIPHFRHHRNTAHY